MKCNFKNVKRMNRELINRKLKDSICEAWQYFPVVTITGPRQSGKTTLCRKLFPDLHYINLEDADIREQMIKDTRHYLNRYKEGLIIDEAHNYPELFSYIQTQVDEDRNKKYVLTGSSNFSLLEKITQSLAGRTVVFTLLPLSLNELGNRINNFSTDTLILRGGYPAVWAYNTPLNMLFRNYYTTYIERDVRQIINIKNMIDFQTFIRLCAGRVGTECNASALGNEVGVSVHTVNSWFSTLAASYIAYLLPPYFENIGKRAVKTPKLYFYDTGLACYLLGIENELQLSTHPLRGALFENLVVNEAMKNRLNRGEDPNLYFYKDRSQKEVDLLFTHSNLIDAYEIKSSQTYHGEFYKGLNYLKSLFKDRIKKTALIYDGTLESDAEDNGACNFRNFYLK